MIRHMTAGQLANRLGYAPTTLALWRTEGRGPRYIKFGVTQQARVRYLEADVLAWEAAQMQTNTGSVGLANTPPTPGTCQPVGKSL
jgi:hypothetical protein